MNGKNILFIIIFIAACFAVWFERAQAPKNLEILEQTSYTVEMQIESSAFKNNGSIPKKYTCDGDNANPPLVFKNVPNGVKSFALVLEDPDVPRSIRPDGMFDHFVMWNISSEIKIVEEGALPAGIFGKNTAGTKKYIGPCPPDREHRYFFKLFALDEQISLPEGSVKSELLSAMEGHVISEAELVGRYNRMR